ncbi:MAG: hypothetical protein Q7U82_01535 [Gammaproteobacteria bacterium]|nr:hypothetical protein [Gammaproteobacteria bacterium]
MEIEIVARVRSALEKSWSARTSLCFNTDIAPASYGQCAPTAIVVHEYLGGEILKTRIQKYDGSFIRHFYNRIDGHRHDFTASQFEMDDYWLEVNYEDVPSSVEEALTEMMPGQIDAMRSAFKSVINELEHGKQFQGDRNMQSCLLQKAQEPRQYALAAEEKRYAELGRAQK